MDHIPRILIKTVEPENQRYPTCGDYFYDAQDDTLTVFVSKMSDWRSELAVAIHELFEAVKCIHDEVEVRAIDLFDFQFERERDDGKHDEVAEPGDDKRAPYHRQHVSATFIEREVCVHLALPWTAHEENIEDA